MGGRSDAQGSPLLPEEARTVTESRAEARHPKGLYVLFFTELWERFGFYTMIAIFTLYMKAPRAEGGLGLDTATAGSFYALFMGLVYFTPLLGGLAADLLIGMRWAITIGAVFLGAGYFVLSAPPSDDLVLLYVAMGSIVIGNGLLKPNISTMVGRLYSEDSPLRDAGFNIFYTGINLGALVAPAAAAFLRTRWSWQAAFAAAGVGMIASLITFVTLSRHYRDADKPKEKKVDPSRDAGKADGVSSGHRILALMILLVVSTMFWTLFFQNGFALTLWADECTTRPDWLTPELFQMVNPVCIVLLSSSAAWVWSRLGKAGKEPTTPSKILMGLAVSAVACLVMVGASYAGGDSCADGIRVSMMWLVSTYVFISLAEILVSPMGLSYCTQIAPGKLGGLVMGGWFASLAAGGYLSGWMGGRLWESLPHSTYFLILVVGMAAVSVLLFAVRGVLDRASGAR